jgi:hypothetical protein
MSLVTEAGGTFGGAHSSVGRGVPSAQAVFSAAMNLSRTALGGVDGAAKRWPADRAPRFEKFSDLRDSSYTCMQPPLRCGQHAEPISHHNRSGPAEVVESPIGY